MGGQRRQWAQVEVEPGQQLVQADDLRLESGEQTRLLRVGGIQLTHRLLGAEKGGAHLLRLGVQVDEVAERGLGFDLGHLLSDQL